MEEARLQASKKISQLKLGTEWETAASIITYPQENARCFGRDTLNELLGSTVLSLFESLHQRISPKFVLNIMHDIVVCEVL